MLTDSWLMTFIVILFYVVILLLIFGFAYLLRFIMDKIEENVKERERLEQGHKDSVEILSMIEPNETGCNVDKMFSELEKNNMNTDFKYKI